MIKDVVLVTGSGGLVGSSVTREFSRRGLTVVGIDNDMRSKLFGPNGSVALNVEKLKSDVPTYRHYVGDIRDERVLKPIFARYAPHLYAVVHCAAQPSHDWASSDPETDFSINALGTLRLLEFVRHHAPSSTFVYVSTNKVYGDLPNKFSLVELQTRWELASSNPYFSRGVDENASIDQTLHSLFGVSKTTADLLVQEYGRYYEMNTGCFRAGCITGGAHTGVPLHGFLAYLSKCALTNEHYTIHGYSGKQVRDNIHATDLAEMFWHFCRSPRRGEVYNVGGGRHNNCSVIEAIAECERRTGREFEYTISEMPRKGDHIWWITDTGKFERHYEDWKLRYDMEKIFDDLFSAHLQ